MDSLINAAARALASGDPFGALKRVALREDAPALALRGIAMAQLGDLVRAKAALKRAARAFGQKESVARARCIVAEAELALVARDIRGLPKVLDAARATLESQGDRLNALHARSIAARRLLLIGHLDAAERALGNIDSKRLPPALTTTLELIAAGIAIRRLQIRAARTALDRARHAARLSGILTLMAEVDNASRILDTPAAKVVARGEERIVLLDEVATLLDSDALVVDACRHAVKGASTVIPLGTRPVLFALTRALAQAWPGDVSRTALIRAAFRGRHADESYRARLRVEIGRLRVELRSLADVSATRSGYALTPQGTREIVVLAPPVENEHAAVLALLADGEAWSSSALALALGASPRTVQRTLEQLARDGNVQSFGRGRARRWVTPSVPGFPTSLLLPGPLPSE